MIKVEYGELSKRSLENYYTFLVGKFYKILPLKEERSETLREYISSLSCEVIGNSYLLNDLKYDPKFISLLNILQYFINEEYDVKSCKREVFKAIKLIEDINKQYFKEGGVDVEL